MPHVLAYTMAAAVCTYCTFGGFSYILFGQATQGNVIDNIPKVAHTFSSTATSRVEITPRPIHKQPSNALVLLPD